MLNSEVCSQFVPNNNVTTIQNDVEDIHTRHYKKVLSMMVPDQHFLRLAGTVDKNSNPDKAVIRSLENIREIVGIQNLWTS